MRRLYIIGNGFDIAHGIKSRYSDYREWLKKRSPDLYEKLIAIYGDTDEFWGEFEKNLSNIDITRYKSENYLKDRPITSEEKERGVRVIRWCPTAWQLEELYIRMKDSFFEWVRDLEIMNRKRKKHFVLRKCSARFLSFNYTDTLETLYKAPNKKILHIHGRVKTAKNRDNLILGHGADEKTFVSEFVKASELPEDYDIRALDLDYQHLFDQVFKMFKDVDLIINNNAKWFENVNNVKRINILGVSFSEVDILYFDYIIKNHKQINGVKWKVTWHSQEDKSRILAFFERHHISSTKYNLIKK